MKDEAKSIGACGATNIMWCLAVFTYWQGNGVVKVT